MDKVLVCIAHPDDEVLMAGGTIAKHVSNGDEVQVLILADGVTSRDGWTREDFRKRWEQASKASDVLGYNGNIIGLADNKLDTIPLLTIIKHVEKVIYEFQPTIVITHWHGDMNVDHRIVSHATKTACRARPGCSVNLLLMGEVPCSTGWAGGFNPDYFVSINIEPKLVALQCYEGEMPSSPHPRSYANVLALANVRGAQAGVIRAEAFELVRRVA